jgi:hypothetical protein
LIAIGFAPNGITIEARRDRVDTRARESRPRTSSIRDTFHRQDPAHPRTRRTTRESHLAVVEKPRGVSFWERGRSRDEDRPSLDDTVRSIVTGAIDALARFDHRRAHARRLACDQPLSDG